MARILALCALSPLAAAQAVFLFSAPGGPFTLTLPASGCAFANVTLVGGGGSGQFGAGGSGAALTFPLAALPGEVLTVWVGGGGSGPASLASNQKT